MTVAERFLRNSRITRMTRKPARISVNWTSSMASRIDTLRSKSILISIAAGSLDWKDGSTRLMASTVSMVLAPGCR
jgi:hypothetical protein